MNNSQCRTKSYLLTIAPGPKIQHLLRVWCENGLVSALVKCCTEKGIVADCAAHETKPIPRMNTSMSQRHQKNVYSN